MKVEDLKEFGKVEQCEEVNDMFHIKVTDGYKESTTNYLSIMNKITNTIGDVYPMVHKQVVDKDHFELVLKKQLCYKTNKPCLYNCHGQCKESC